MRDLTRETVEGAVRRNLAHGMIAMDYWPEDDDPRAAGKAKAFRLTWQPKCDNPYRFDLHGSKSVRRYGKRRPIRLYGEGRCRKCEACMEARGFMWRERALVEFYKAPRSLFGSITMSPEQHYAMDARIHSGERAEDGRFIRHPKNLRELSPEELFQARVSIFGEELTLWIKRLRKKFGTNCMRYMLVAEAHDSDKTSVEMRGRPHFHMLVHDYTENGMVSGNPLDAITSGRDGEWEKRLIKTKQGYRGYAFVTDDAFIRKNWQLGFTKFQLASTEHSVFYLCKYLSKAMMARVRASIDYGAGASPASTIHEKDPSF